MTRPIINIPRELMKVAVTDWDVDWRNQGAIEDTGGGDQTVFSAFPRWIGNPTVIAGRREIMAWRALRDLAQGRVAAYRVPMIDRMKSALDRLELAPSFPSMPLVTSTPANRPAHEVRPYVTAAEAISAGATSILVSEAGAPMEIPIGWTLSHNDWPFRVTWREKVGPNVRLGVSMMRRAIPDGASIDIIPTGLFLAKETPSPKIVGDVAAIELQFEEYITR